MNTNPRQLITVALLLIYLFMSGQTKIRVDLSTQKTNPVTLAHIHAHNSFAIIVLPDTQYYTYMWPEIFEAQTQWIVNQQHSMNIVMMAHLGDIVQNAELEDEWAIADLAITPLDEAFIPYGLVVGNHDQFPRGSPEGTTNFNTTFPYERYQDNEWHGHAGNDNDNHFVLFDGCGQGYVSIFLECDFQVLHPEHITWAESVLQAYSERQAIIYIHNLLGGTGYWNCPQASTLWASVKDEPNLILMMGGHICEEVYRGKMSDDGHIVHCMTVNYQCLPNGGQGWLRILRFIPSQHIIQVETYSPWLDEYQSDENSQYELVL